MDKAHLQALFRQRAEARGVPATGRHPTPRPAQAAEPTPQQLQHEPAVQASAAPEEASEPAAKKQRMPEAVPPVPPQALPAGFFDAGVKPPEKAQPQKSRPDAAAQVAQVDVKCAVLWADWLRRLSRLTLFATPSAALNEFKAAVAEDVQAVDEREREEQARVDPPSCALPRLTPATPPRRSWTSSSAKNGCSMSSSACTNRAVIICGFLLTFLPSTREFESRVAELKRKADESRAAALPAVQQAPAAAQRKEVAPPDVAAGDSSDDDDFDAGALLDWRAKRAV